MGFPLSTPTHPTHSTPPTPAYEAAKRVLADRRDVPTSQLPLMDVGVAGSLSAVPTTAIMAPGERIKVLLQTQAVGADGSRAFKGPGDVVRHLFAGGSGWGAGVRSLFRGSALTLARDGTGSFAYFAVYEAIKRGSGGEAGLSPAGVVLGGGAAGCAHWLVALPLDTVKSRVQSATGHSSGAEVARALWASEGVAGFYKGLTPALLRAFPANAACFGGLEASKSLMARYW